MTMKATLLACCLFLAALPASRGALIGFAADNVAIQTSHATYSAGKADTLDVRFEVTDQWSFIRFVPKADGWDLSAFESIEVVVTNTGNTTTRMALRVDQAGPTKSEFRNTSSMQTIAPGVSVTITVRFGLDYNKITPIDTSKIGAIHIFIAKNQTEPSALTISSIKGVPLPWAP
ncbi:MAG: hypothetical protein H7Y06_11640 [Opitutaceae bacterium]|nr:hypothetical protein [Opitutaceae bacterium]